MQTRDYFNIGAAVILALAVAPPAIAQSAAAKATVDAAKAAGIVGEQADGFLGFVSPSSDAAVKSAVAEINAGRAQLYREAAAKNKVSVEAAGASAFTNVVLGRIQPGEYFKPAGGGWTKK